MTSRQVFRAIVAAAGLLMASGGAFANCLDVGGFAIFQCADLAWVAPPPVPVTFDPNGRPTNISLIFWQLGYGNQTLNNALGTAGTGNSGASTFNGNDSGNLFINFKNAQTATGNQAVPAGSTCISTANWADNGVDGCADNIRTTTLPNADDGLLNEYFDAQQAFAYGARGYYSLAWQQDYPMAMLLKTMTDTRYFAIAAVATLNRNNAGNGQNGSCAPANAGTNPAPCDVRPGYYTFEDVRNGDPNPAAPGLFNIIPWQTVPRPTAACVANCLGTGSRTVNFTWPPVKWATDQSVRATNNPSLATKDTALPRDATRAAGVGVLDLQRKWGGLMRYTLQRADLTASNINPNGTVNYGSLTFLDAFPDIPQPAIDPNTGNPPAGATVALNGASVPADTCWRVKVQMGKKPDVLFPSTTVANCRLGKCGDLGYEAVTSDGSLITCIGGALLAESVKSATATRSKGDVAVHWETAGELTMREFKVYAVRAQGDLLLATVACKECSSSLGAIYDITVPGGSLKGSKTLRIDVIGDNPSSTTVPIQ